LVVAERTAARHLENIFNKLGLHSRAQLTAWAVRQGLLDESAR
jgi:DNA-binding NarL/FixJ family response regulator